MTDYQRCFIENEKFYRKKCGFSQSRLAELCDVSTGTIGNIECGITKPSFDLIVTLADRLHTTPEALFHADVQPVFEEENPVFTKKQLQRIRQALTATISDTIRALAK